MKITILSATICLLLPILSMANQLPECWNNPAVVEGNYLVTIDAEQASKSELLDTLNALSGHHITPSGYPIIFEDFLIITVHAVDYGVGDYRLSKKELQEAVEKELSPLNDEKFISMSCNQIIHLPWVRGSKALPQCIEDGSSCTLYGTACCNATSSCQGSFPNTTCQ
jgi:hypothetical protein